jgi:hypothetical protein
VARPAHPDSSHVCPACGDRYLLFLPRPPQLGRGVLRTARNPDSPLPPRLDDEPPVRLPPNVPIAVRGTERRPLPFAMMSSGLSIVITTLHSVTPSRRGAAKSRHDSRLLVGLFVPKPSQPAIRLRYLAVDLLGLVRCCPPVCGHGCGDRHSVSHTATQARTPACKIRAGCPAPSLAWAASLRWSAGVLFRESAGRVQRLLCRESRP